MTCQESMELVFHFLSLGRPNTSSQQRGGNVILCGTLIPPLQCCYNFALKCVKLDLFPFAKSFSRCQNEIVDQFNVCECVVSTFAVQNLDLGWILPQILCHFSPSLKAYTRLIDKFVFHLQKVSNRLQTVFITRQNIHQYQQSVEWVSACCSPKKLHLWLVLAGLLL